LRRIGRVTLLDGVIQELDEVSFGKQPGEGTWSRIPDADGELRLADWGPSAGTASLAPDQIGLFERWQKNALRYLVPETGEIFKISRGADCK